MVQEKDGRGGVGVGVGAGLGRWIWMLVKGSQTVRIKEEHGAARLRKARDLGLNFYLFFIFCCFIGWQHGIFNMFRRAAVAFQQENELQRTASAD